MTTYIVDGLIAALLLCIAAVLSAIETAMSGVSRARIEDMEETRGMQALLPVTENRAHYLNPLILLRTVCEAAAAALITVLCVGTLSKGWAVTVAVIVISLLTYVFLGVVSRTLGRQNPYTVASRAALILTPLTKILGPLATVLIKLGNLLTPGKNFEEGPFANEVELREMVDIASERGIVQVEERRMIQAVFDLAQTRARQVMVPRTDMLWIEAEKTAAQAISLCVRSGHSRIPVVGDTVDDILGVAYLKDIVATTYKAPHGGKDLLVRDVMRPAEFVPDSILLDELLHDMQTSHDHIAMLVDEFGGIAGLISIEDILEEIVGEISDEYDDAEMAPVTELEDGSFRVVARLTLEELVELFDEFRGVDIEFSEEQLDEVETVGGLLAFELGRVPLPGAEVETAGLRLQCEGGRDRRGRIRIRSVVVSQVPEPQKDGSISIGVMSSLAGSRKVTLEESRAENRPESPANRVESRVDSAGRTDAVDAVDAVDTVTTADTASPETSEAEKRTAATGTTEATRASEVTEATEVTKRTEHPETPEKH